jgi:hypothetical protein
MLFLSIFSHPLQHVVVKDNDAALEASLANLTAAERAIKLENEKKLRQEKAKKEEQERESQFKKYSAHLLIFWMLCNLLWVGVISQFSSSSVIYGTVLIFGATFQQGFMLLGSIIFALQFYVIKVFYCFAYVFSCGCCGGERERSRRNLQPKTAGAGGSSNYITAAVAGISKTDGTNVNITRPVVTTGAQGTSSPTRYRSPGKRTTSVV